MAKNALNYQVTMLVWVPQVWPRTVRHSLHMWIEGSPRASSSCHMLLHVWWSDQMANSKHM